MFQGIIKKFQFNISSVHSLIMRNKCENKLLYFIPLNGNMQILKVREKYIGVVKSLFKA